MRKVLREHRIILLTMLITAALTMGLPSYWNYIYTTPVDLPISLSPPGSITAQFNVPIGNNYVLKFVFDREGHSSQSLEELIGRTVYMKREGFTIEKLQKAIGDRYYKTHYAGENIGIKTGTPVTVRWEIRSLNNKDLIQQEIETIGRDSWNGIYVTRNISEFPSPVPNYTMSGFYLSSGKHELNVAIINDAHNMAGIKTHIRLIPNPSKDDYVLRQLIWYALIAIDAVLVIVLGFNVWRRGTKNG